MLDLNHNQCHVLLSILHGFTTPPRARSKSFVRIYNKYTFSHIVNIVKVTHCQNTDYLKKMKYCGPQNFNINFDKQDIACI